MSKSSRPATATASPRRLRLIVRGRVQGVGFRPHVSRLAHRYHLGGWIANTAQGATIEIEGQPSTLDAFQADLLEHAPPAAAIEHLASQSIPVQGERTFWIRSSRSDGSRFSAMAPDLATCAECLRELFDPRNRRHRYPFITCAGCGPRYSILQNLPYDRAKTTMKRFSLCRDCAQEYDTMTDRRFHAETIACPACGPRVWLCDRQGPILAEGEDALERACTVIREGGIVAVKGLGGFQLWVDATNDAAVRQLRLRKQRPRKPLVVLFPSLADLEAYCRLNGAERDLLVSPEAPIVLVQKRDGAPLAPAVAPDNPEIGAMLPYTPLHHLLMADLGRPVVATSGNRSDEPIAIADHDALARLAGIADVFLLHDRPIARPVDDSVVQVEDGRVRMLRRARGYVPSPSWTRAPRSALPEHAPLLAVGGHLKTTIAVTTPDHVVLSQHLGDLSTSEACAQFTRTVEDQLTMFAVRPRAVACDLHPDYPSTAFAHRFGEMRKIPVVPVQHHHAHIVAGMAEHGLDGPVLGVAWDGAGYGPDGTIWGGEFFVCEDSTFTRVAHLRPFPLPGGEAAMREPRRTALSLLYDTFGADAVTWALPPRDALGTNLAHALVAMLARRVQCPMTTSMGRLFDGVSSLLGYCQISTFEGEAAMALEFGAAARPAPSAGANDSEPAVQDDPAIWHPLDEWLPVSGGHDDPPEKSTRQGKPWTIDWRPLVAALATGVLHGQDAHVLARLFHRACAAVIVRIARRTRLDRIVLGGGVFQNRLLCRLAREECERAGIDLYVPQQVPCNDGGLALGQAIIADHLLRKRTRTHEPG